MNLHKNARTCPKSRALRLMRPGGARAVVAESLIVKHQLVILNRSRERSPNLRPLDVNSVKVVHTG